MKITIKNKISIMFASTVALLLLGIYLYLNPKLKEITYNDFRTRIKKQAILAKIAIEEFTLHSNNFDEIAKKIGSNTETRITIINRDGNVEGDSVVENINLMENYSEKKEVIDALEQGIGESQRFSTVINKKLFYYAIKLKHESGTSIIRLAVPVEEIDRILKTVSQSLSVALILAFLMSLSVSVVISNIISSPIKKLSETAKKIANGNFVSKIFHKSNDEIGELASSFNSMITEIEKRMEEINSNESRMQAVLFSMFDGVMVVDNKSKILLMNNSLQKLLEINSNFIGEKAIKITKNLEIHKLIEEVISKKSKLVSTEIIINAIESKILTVHASSICKNDELIGAVLVFHDITELRKLESIRKDFVANVSHELRTPVSNIKGYAETLVNGAIDDKNYALDFSKVILSESDRLIILINDLLDLSKIESGNLTLDLKPCSLKKLLDDLLPKVETEAANKSLKINVEISEKLPNILADKNSIIQVLFNIIDNAIKYTLQGSVTIKAMEENDFIKINIIDTGIGIPENDIDRIFERFYRVDKARSKQVGGTGLGLAIVKHIVLSHQGNIFVKSKIGTGSTFSFTLLKA